MLSIERSTLCSTARPARVSRPAMRVPIEESALPAVVALHYPLRDRHGARYGGAPRACIDAEPIEAACVRHARVRLVVHGHEHHGFRTELPRPGDPIPVIDPGAGGYAFLPERRRTAHFCVYDLDDSGLSAVERFAFDGERFVAEAGGAFATGR